MFSRPVAIIITSSLLLTACEGIRSNPSSSRSSSSARASFSITSPAFAPGEGIPVKYTCDGENISPPLQVDAVPSRARSLALVMDDPDAGTGDFVHWVLWNIDPYGKGEIVEGQEPKLSQRGRNGTGSVGYTGPCPPSGTHHYRFKIYALTKYLEFPSAPTREELEEAMRGFTVDRAMMTATYSRK